jgi:hypothetical protein
MRFSFVVLREDSAAAGCGASRVLLDGLHGAAYIAAHDDRLRTRKAPPPPCHPGTGDALVVTVPLDRLRGTF